jgi:hypothetical protein
MRPLAATLAALTLALAGACAARPVPTPTAPTAPQPAPTCQVLPQPTGEKFVDATIEAPPPAQAAPGQEIAITLSGAYGLVGNNLITCPGQADVYAFSDELPAFDWAREIEVQLAGRAVAAVTCQNPCRIVFTIPADTPPGLQALTLLAARVDPVTFSIAIAAPGAARSREPA